MRTTIKFAIALAMGLLIPMVGVQAENTQPMFNYCWANGIIYALVTPTNAKANTGLSNDIYYFRNLAGQRPVADAGPGDADYHNGHFQTVLVEFTPEGIKALDPNSDGICEFEMTNSEMVQSYIKKGYLKITGRGDLIDEKLVSPEPYRNEVK